MSAPTPECMEPDGGSPCAAYTLLVAEVRTLRNLLAMPHEAELQEVLDNIIESGLLSEEQYNVLAAAIWRQSSSDAVEK